MPTLHDGEHDDHIKHPHHGDRCLTGSVLVAQKWALVKFVVALQQREVEDRAAACEANGWRHSSAHDLYDDVIDTVSRLATGSLDAEAYLEEERRLALEVDSHGG